MSKTPRTDDALSCVAKEAMLIGTSRALELENAELQRRLDLIGLMIGEWKDDGGLLGQIAQLARGEYQP